MQELMLKKSSQNPPEKHQPSSIDLYSAHDPIPVPEAIESDTDAAWCLWEDALSSLGDEPAKNSSSVTGANPPRPAS
jgi:hypothetical protein